MKKILCFAIVLTGLTGLLQAQTEAAAGKRKTWFISSEKDFRLEPAPASDEKTAVLAAQKNLKEQDLQQISYWAAGSAGYRWQQLISSVWMNELSYTSSVAYMLVGVATYDATIAAWDTKYTYNRKRPFQTDSRIKRLVPDPASPSYPCEHSVAAGVASTVIAHYFPAMADSVQKLARQLMASRIAAGVAFPSDTEAGFELGRRIALKEIELTREFATKKTWDGKMPSGSQNWRGKYPMLPLAGLNKTVVLDSASQFRPGPPPDFAKDMEELKKFKPTFASMANAFYFASQSVWDEVLHKKIFEYNLHMNPLLAAEIYAVAAIGMYDGFTACWDAKYAYWGIRPDQYDTTFRPALFFTPPFPGYPSGHAMLGSVMAEIYSFYFPAEAAYFRKLAKEGAESRFQGGIHFRTDNDVALDMGKKVGRLIVEKAGRMHTRFR